MKTQLLVHPNASLLIDAYLKEPSHATLLTGPAGIGKTLLAREISEELLGRKLENNAYYREITPVKQVITIEQVRNLLQFFRLSVPGTAKIKRVAVLQDADAMGTEAQNALLKMLEEPPEGSVLLLTSSNALGLLPTIRSRTQLLQVPAPEQAAILQYFVARKHDEETVRQSVLRHSGTIAAIAAELDPDTDRHDDSLQLVRQVLSGRNYERLLIVDSLSKQKEQAVEFVTTLSNVAAASLESTASKASPNISRWQAVLTASHVASEALRQNGNTKLVLTELMLEL